MSKTRSAVVGVGYLGRFHAQKYNSLDEAELVGVCDASPERAKQVADELRVSFFSDYKDLVGKVDAVTVASTTRTHFEIAKFFLQNGVHVNVEKPMTATVAEAEELVALAESRKLVLAVGHVERFNPAFELARERLGAPMIIECQRLAPYKPRGVDVDVVSDLMIHDIDLALAVARSPVKSVTASGGWVLTSETDYAVAEIEFESGAVAHITSSRISPTASRKLGVLLSDRHLAIDLSTGEVVQTIKKGEWEADKVPLSFESWTAQKGDALLNETKAFLRSVRTGAAPVASGLDGVAAMIVATRVQEQIAARRERIG